MHFFTIFLLLLPLLIQTDTTPRTPEVYNINLDLPPSERFKEVVLDKKAGVKELKNSLVKTLRVPEYIVKALGYYEKMVYSDHDCYEELLGVAKYSELTFGEVFLVNFIYEILASCTSIISVDPQGHIIHGRNLDYDFKDILVNLTVRFKFWKNGTLLYEGDGVAGFLGLVTGLKHNAFGVSINQRSKGGLWESFYEILIKRTFSIPYFIRKVLEYSTDYDTAVKMFSSEEFAAPCYLIVSGMKENEGVVITRDRRGIANVSQINVDDPDQWFIVQTNYDRDLPDPKNDYRRVPAEKRMRDIGRDGINEKRMFDDILNLVPNMNPTTIITSIMSAQTGYFNTTIWA